jgi:hypothetical protein
MAICFPGDLLNFDKCKATLPSFMVEVIRTQMLCNWKNLLSGGSGSRRITEEGSVRVTEEGDVRVTEDSSGGGGGGGISSCDIADLLADAACFFTLPPFVLKVLQLQLLCDIYNLYNASPGDNRITEEGAPRVTEEGDLRVTEP